MVTLASLAMSLIGAALLVVLPDPGSWPSALLLFAIWQLSYGLDCADGLLARRLGRSSPYGAWLDQVVDLVGHLAIFGALGAFVVTELGLATLPAVLSTVAIVAGNCVLGVAVGLRGALLGGETVAFDRPRLGLVARLLHLVDYGLVLAICAVLLLAPRVLAIYLAGVATVSLIAVAGLAILLARRSGSTT
jgi:CDP-diacylglycerol--glycerol-3-phosphate 3-phosphatidyltransferase